MFTGVVVAGMVLAVAVPAAAGHLSFTRADYADSRDKVPFPRAVDHADVDGDRDLDVVTANTGHDEVSVLINVDGERNFTFDGSYGVGLDRPQETAQPWDAIAADVTGSEAPDIVSANYESGDLSVLEGTSGGSSFTHCGDFAVGGGPRAVAAADFNGDGHVDLAAANPSTPSPVPSEETVSVLFGLPGCNFAPPVQYPVGDSPQAMAAGDLDGDGYADLVTANCLSHNVSVLLNTGRGGVEEPGNADAGIDAGAGVFKPHATYAVGICPRGVAIANPDLDGQNGPDLVTANNASDDVSVLLGNGDGTFGSATHYPTTTETDADGNLVETDPSGVAVEDFDADGRQDVAVSNDESDDVGVLTGDGSGGLDTVENFTVNNRPYDVVAADFDPPGKPDVITASLYGHGISVLWNDTP